MARWPVLDSGVQRGSAQRAHETIGPTQVNESKVLAEAWEQVHALDLLPMGYAEEFPTRHVIDAAAAVALGLRGDEIADWGGGWRLSRPSPTRKLHNSAGAVKGEA